MNIKINLPEHNKIAEFRAKLIMECIKQQDISSKKKNLILEELIKKLEFRRLRGRLGIVLTDLSSKG